MDDHFGKYVLPLIAGDFGLWAYAYLSAEMDIRTTQVALALVGLWWCLAALWVEVKIEKVYPGFDHENPTDPQMKAYKPFCDFAPWANCSKVLMSPSGRFLRYFGIAKQGGGEGWLNTIRGWIDVPNPTLGVLFFSCHLFYNVLIDIVNVLIGVSSIFKFADWFLPYAFFIACCGVACMAVWLAYKLFFVLQDFCVVCVSMYVTIGALVAVMYRICHVDSSTLSGFGAVPPNFLYPFMLMLATMLVAVLALYFSEGSHSSEDSYKQLEDGVVLIPGQ